VKVKFQDQANIQNTTNQSRTGSQSMGTPSLFGAERIIARAGADPASLVSTTGTNSNEGKGTVTRSETLTTDIAAVVTQVLPNGNLVIEGKQEVRVNFEVRELIVAGVVRPEDIEAGNTIESTKIAQARISYGGRGQITDVQQPRYGQQALDVLLPF
jgi:flagellar L-ring protein precursor FlgH